MATLLFPGGRGGDTTRPLAILGNGKAISGRLQTT